MSRLALGTVQFGLDYGVANVGGKVPEAEIRRILDEAANQDISLLDTASAYGASEDALGSCLRNRPRKFDIVTKFDRTDIPVAEQLSASLLRLGVPDVRGYLAHGAELYREPGVVDQLRELCGEGKIGAFGVSLYAPSELDDILNRGLAPQLVQIPMNLLDHRFAPLLSHLSSTGVEVHVRSAFLQGLFFLESFPPFFESVEARIRGLRERCRVAGIPVQHLLLHHLLGMPEVSKVVIGVDSAQQLATYRELEGSRSVAIQVLSELGEFPCTNDEILLPYKWRLS